MLLRIVPGRKVYRNVNLPLGWVAAQPTPLQHCFSTRSFLAISVPSTTRDEPDKESLSQQEQAEIDLPDGFRSRTTVSKAESAHETQRASLSSLIPASSQSNHSSQTTFLTHSRRTGLNPSSAVFTGTRYEYLTQSSLRRLGIELAKVGGSGDKGVDLVGFWHLAQWLRNTTVTADGQQSEEQGASRIKVVVQCKRISSTARTTRAIGPSVVRELEGAFRGAPAGWRGFAGGDSVLGILVSTRPATKGVIEGMKRSERPLGWVLLEEVEGRAAGSEENQIGGALDEIDDHQNAGIEEDDEAGNVRSSDYTLIKGRIRQILWNQKASELGLEGLDVVKRYPFAEEDTEDKVVLMWQGKPVAGLPGDDF